MKNLFKKEVADRNSISLIPKHFHFRFRKKKGQNLFLASKVNMESVSFRVGTD